MKRLHKPMYCVVSRMQIGGLINLAGIEHHSLAGLQTPLPNSHGFTLTPTPIMFSVRSALANIPRASRLTARPVVARAYHEKVISHYEQPRNVRSGPQPRPPCPFLSFSVYLIIISQVGSLPKNDIDVGTGLVGAPAYVILSPS